MKMIKPIEEVEQFRLFPESISEELQSLMKALEAGEYVIPTEIEYSEYVIGDFSIGGMPDDV